jgi:enoyl-[acyl-carrier protein] reductase II
MQTRITQLLGISHPVFCPGMTYVSTAELVAAVSNAGGLGILAVGHLNEEQTRQEIQKTKRLTNKPFGVGVALIMPGATRNAEIAIEEKVPVINFSLGKGNWICEKVHAYGGHVIATVVNAKHAKAAERAGVDALMVTGHEAAAHGGDVTSLVLVPAIRQVTTLPIIATGGFGTGGGLVAALVLGADAIAMGTRFAASHESPVHENTKRLIVEKTESDTLYSANFDGMPCRVMKTPTSERRMAKKLTLFRAVGKATSVAMKSGQPLLGLAKEVSQNGFMETLKLTYFGAATEEIRRAIIEGDHQNGVQLIGQVQGLIHDIPTAAVIIERVLKDANVSLASVNTQAALSSAAVAN